MMMEIDVLMELKQALLKEDISNGLTIKKLPDNFYSMVKDYIAETNNTEAKVLFARFKRHRINKLSRLAFVFTPDDTLTITPEEKVLYDSMVEAVRLYWD